MTMWTIVRKGEVDSTQSVAKDLADSKSPEWTVVIAESQSSGRGRLGRSWVSPKGGLYMSVILRPHSMARIQQISLLAALATVQGVEDVANLATRIRWPNDVIASEKKLGGILTEASSLNDEVDSVIVGLGLNCNATVADTVDSDNPATSLVEELGRPVDIDSVASSILQSLSALYSTWSKGQDVTPLWKQKLGTLNRQVSVKMKTSETSFSGTATGVTPEGNLVVSSEGVDHILRAEETEWLRESP